MNKNYLKIKQFCKKSFVTSDEWKKREFGSFDCPNFLVYTKNGMIDGFDRLGCIDEKIVFYTYVKQARDFICSIAGKSGDEIIAIGPYFCSNNFNTWSDINQFDSFVSLSSIIKNNQYALINIKEEINILDLIIENNFRYLSYITIFLKNADMMILPSHNMEFVIFSDKLDEAKKRWSEVIQNTEWELLYDI